MTDRSLPTGFTLRQGTGLDHALLVKFMQRTYSELFPNESFGHLAQTVKRYFSNETPLWWVDGAESDTPVGCLWMGNAIDQVTGDRHFHIFLLYVDPDHRRQGLATQLMRQAEEWARARGDHQLGLQVFQVNTRAIALYQKLGYQVQSLWMLKPLR